MAKRKPGLSESEHIDLARRLAAWQDEATHLVVTLGNAYPKSSPAAREAQKLRRDIEALRQALDIASQQDVTYDGRQLLDGKPWDYFRQSLRK